LRCCHGDMEELIDTCARKAFSHVLVKCVDGASAYRRNAAANAYVCRRIREQGVQVIGLGFHYGRDPEAEAEAAVRSCLDLGHSIYVCNAEREFEADDGDERARRFVEAFSEYSAGRVALGLSAFALPSLHPRFPYRAFLDSCQFVMPQIYTVPSKRRPYLSDLVQYAERSACELAAFDRPVIPTLRAYAGDGVYDRAMITKQARQFLQSRSTSSFSAWNWWVWQGAEIHAPLWRLFDSVPAAKP